MSWHWTREKLLARRSLLQTLMEPHDAGCWSVCTAAAMDNGPQWQRLFYLERSSRVEAETVIAISQYYTYPVVWLYSSFVL